MYSKCLSVFNRVFGGEPELCCFAPGRVNLIGEHTDYNGGHVFPCAISFGIRCAARKRSDNRLFMYSSAFPQLGVCESDASVPALTHDWSDYPKSVILSASRFGYGIQGGAELVFTGDLPDGAGLSSSAAIEVLTGLVLRELYGLPLSGQLLALIGQFAENKFIGVNCGIMDQFASAMGKKDNAILLDSNTLDFSYAPFRSEDVDLVLVNSGVKHSLASSAYNERRRQCEAALADLRQSADVPSLCSLSPAQLEESIGLIKDEVSRRRARHAVSENSRTKAAAEALCCGDTELFGELMNQSHVSLRDDYEVSCPELDLLVETAWGMRGVFGARMTGGGFGGCTVNLIDSRYTEEFCAGIGKAYTEAFGRQCDIYKVGISDGAHKLL